MSNLALIGRNLNNRIHLPPRIINNCFHLESNRSFSNSRALCSFLEWNRRGTPPIYHDRPLREHFQRGRKFFIEECKKFIEEQREYLAMDPKWYQNGDSDVFFRFDKQEYYEKWIVSSDKRNNEGFSECTFVMNDRGKGVFSGNLDTTPPKDGSKKWSGYCAIKSVRKTKSFLRDDAFEWHPFTHIEFRVKGDGRAYGINLGLAMYFDVNWFDTFTYNMYTRGGPYWETYRIPFSKFILASKGRVQDKQQRVPLNKVNSVSILAANVPGPFHLEIDYIGCHIDRRETERCAYELYKIPKEMVTA